VNIRRKLYFAGFAAAITALAWSFGGSVRNWVSLTPVAAQVIAPAVAPWTAVGASGSVDESSIPYFGFTNASAGYKPTASIAPLEFRYNVVNVQHYLSAAGGIPTVTMPGWTTMEFGAQAPGTSVADAYLYRVNRCTGAQTLICAVRHYNQPAPGACKPCQFANTTFNFASYLYYVRVVLDRNTVNELPMAHTLRIY
jgi:hypothetical protein